MGSPPQSRKLSSAFTLVEMIAVIGIIVIVLGLAIPAVTSLKNSNDVTAGSYDIAGALETARSYAMANNTYTWVGFFEENASQAGVQGTGNVVISIVEARDGVQGFDPNTDASASNKLDGTRLAQVGKLIKVGNTHLAAFSDGSGSGATFDQRPIVGKPAQPGGLDPDARIGDGDPTNAVKSFPFYYPVGAASASSAQYTFTKCVQFDPQGESRINGTANIKPVVEVGLRPTHASAVDVQSPNTIAIQLSGITGTVKVYRK